MVQSVRSRHEEDRKSVGQKAIPKQVGGAGGSRDQKTKGREGSAGGGAHIGLDHRGRERGEALAHNIEPVTLSTTCSPWPPIAPVNWPT